MVDISRKLFIHPVKYSLSSIYAKGLDVLIHIIHSTANVLNLCLPPMKYSATYPLTIFARYFPFCFSSSTSYISLPSMVTELHVGLNLALYLAQVAIFNSQVCHLVRTSHYVSLISSKHGVLTCPFQFAHCILLKLANRQSERGHSQNNKLGLI